MNKADNLDEKLLVGFFPLFFNLAETGRAILVARRYMELGGRAIFFSHGGRYEYLVKDLGCDIIRINPLYTEESVSRFESISRGEQKGRTPYTKTFLREAVKNEIAAFKKTGVKMIVSFANPQCSISARVLKIPHVVVTPGLGLFQFSIPDYLENTVTRLFPQKIKLVFLNWYLPRTKFICNKFNKVAKEYNIKPFKTDWDAIFGDVALITNFLEFINIFPNQQQFPSKNYIGIIILEELFADTFPAQQVKQVNMEIKKHLEKPGKSILLSMGSSGEKTFFLRILQTLNKTPYNVIAVYTNILKENELPKLNNNILVKKFVPSIRELHKMVDLAIIHGGQGTVYTAAYAGKPIIGFPMFLEQNLNLEKMVGHGAGLILSKKYFKEKDLLNAIEKIFNNYDTYLHNAQVLSQKLPTPNGDKNATQRLIEIIKSIEEKNNIKK